VTLFHELVHAVDFAFGLLRLADVPRGDHDGVKMSELRCVGLDEFDDDSYRNGVTALHIFSENTYRHDIGVAQRTWYNDPKELRAGPEHYFILKKHFNEARLATRRAAVKAQANTRYFYANRVVNLHVPPVAPVAFVPVVVPAVVPAIAPVLVGDGDDDDEEEIELELDAKAKKKGKLRRSNSNNKH